MAEKIHMNMRVERVSEYSDFRIYKMIGEDGKLYVWLTPKTMVIKDRKMDCCSREDNTIYQGDEIFIVANIKCESEFRGEKQIKINRVEVQERIFAAPSKKEQIEIQLSSVRPCDKLMRVHYGEYKNKYADCETILDSYDYGNKSIQIIVRDYDLRG